MPHAPRRIAFLGRDGAVKHYGIALGGELPRPALAEATRRLAATALPAGATAALAIVYWWANENELHARHFFAPLDDPGALAPLPDAGLACVWELEVIDFERRAWLRDVLEDGDPEAYLDRALAEALV
jgi:hypothetical protein